MTAQIKTEPAGFPHRDAFNWPSLNRKDLLSQTGGLGVHDGFENKV